MRRYVILGVVAIVLVLAAVKSLSEGTASAAPVAGNPATDTATPTATPTVGIMLPLILKQSTPTPTPTIGILLPLVVKQPTSTPTSTPTLTMTATATHPPYVITTGHLSGQIALKDHPEIPQYYMNIEWIKFFNWIHNESSTTVERYQILGVQVTWPDGVRNAFHTIWTGAPDYIGGIPPGSANCYGPSGSTLDWNLPLRCAPDIGSAQTEDHVGASSNIPVDTPGIYTMQYYVCQSASVSACSNNGEWHPLGGSLTFTAVPPAQELHSLPMKPIGDLCQLKLTGASQGSLHCAPYKAPGERPGAPR